MATRLNPSTFVEERPLTPVEEDLLRGLVEGGAEGLVQAGRKRRQAMAEKVFAEMVLAEVEEAE